jgi:hypothetical protein
MSEDTTPNTKSIDKAVKDLLKDAAAKDADEISIERRRKSIMVAISWEKVRHGITAADEPFDPDSM